MGERKFEQYLSMLEKALRDYPIQNEIFFDYLSQLKTLTVEYENRLEEIGQRLAKLEEKQQYIRRWRERISSYRTEELRAIKFSSRSELTRAIRLFWEDRDLQGIPHATPDGITVIIPQDAINVLKDKGLRVSSISELLNHSEISPKELGKLRWKYGM